MGPLSKSGVGRPRWRFTCTAVNDTAERCKYAAHSGIAILPGFGCEMVSQVIRDRGLTMVGQPAGRSRWNT